MFRFSSLLSLHLRRDLLKIFALIFGMLIEVYLQLLAGREAEKAAEEMRVMEAMKRNPL